jgi:hypothetical protein
MGLLRQSHYCICMQSIHGGTVGPSDSMRTKGEQGPRRYGGPGQRSPDYSAFGQITGLRPCKLQALSATQLAGQPVV